MKKSQRRVRLYPKIHYMPNTEHPAWSAEGPTPTVENTPQAFYAAREYVPSARECRQLARRPVLEGLSRTRVRKRLSAAGLSGSALAKAVHDIKNCPGVRGRPKLSGDYALGWPVVELRRLVGKRFARAVLRNVRIVYVMKWRKRVPPADCADEREANVGPGPRGSEDEA